MKIARRAPLHFSSSSSSSPFCFVFHPSLFPYPFCCIYPFFVYVLYIYTHFYKYYTYSIYTCMYIESLLRVCLLVNAENVSRFLKGRLSFILILPLSLSFALLFGTKRRRRKANHRAKPTEGGGAQWPSLQY